MVMRENDLNFFINLLEKTIVSRVVTFIESKQAQDG
jgi:hypothetical protein